MRTRLLALVALLLMMVSCITFKPVSQTLTTSVPTNVDVTSNVDNVDVYFNGQRLGTTPCRVRIPIEASQEVVTNAEMKGNKLNYSTKQGQIKYAPWVLTFVRNGRSEQVSYHPESLPEQDNALQLYYQCGVGGSAEVVSRDNPGGTSLEGTIIRWFFDSDPRGARIYYRVISNVPEEVKNTNETYLMSTPYEETRAFNILGLTYENSKDVQIEIKVSKRGFEDQVKRYNVRQAIDQQEISGFFDLVPKSASQGN